MKANRIKFWMTYLLTLISYQCYADNIVLDLAHRGYAAKNEEASFNALQYALEKNTDGLEFDLRQTKDGIVVLSHEHKIKEINNEKVENLSYQEIKKYTKIISLQDAVLIAKKYNKPIWIELKNSELYPKMIDVVLSIIVEQNYVSNTVIQSFSLNDLTTIHELNKDIKLLKLYITNSNYKELPRYIDYVGLPIVVGFFSLNIINNAHDLGRKVIFWRESGFFESKFVIKSLIKRGADGFMVDKPLPEILN